MTLKDKHHAIADTIARQLERHGYHLTREEALDVAAQIVMGHMLDDGPRTDIDREQCWRPADGGCWDFTDGEVRS